MQILINLIHSNSDTIFQHKSPFLDKFSAKTKKNLMKIQLDGFFLYLCKVLSAYHVRLAKRMVQKT